MRELKFRAWTGEFYTNVYDINWVAGGLRYSDGCTTEMWVSLNPNHKKWDGEKPTKFAVLEQFTGLKDKNGKEIYEHDIVIVSTKYPKKKVAQIIGWDTELGRWCFTYDTGEAMKAISRGEKGVLEVIGNINENPHLMP